MSQICFHRCDVESVFEAAYLEACRHRWIESQIAGRDLGDTAIRDWYRKYWWPFLRYRHVEHLLGDRGWREFDATSFGVLDDALRLRRPLAMEIIDLYRTGWENLNIIHHSLHRNYPMDEVRGCLKMINMNDARLDPQFH